jgi:hypothetical protein
VSGETPDVMGIYRKTVFTKYFMHLLRFKIFAGLIFK